MKWNPISPIKRDLKKDLTVLFNWLIGLAKRHKNRPRSYWDV